MIKIFSYHILFLLLGAYSACGQQNTYVKPYGLWTLDISPDDKYVALGGDDSLLRIFTNDLKPYKTIKANGMNETRPDSIHRYFRDAFALNDNFS